jgi:AcrR family transcriptional regulator
VTTSEGTGAVDGRRARRERGRLAVLDAMVDLLREGRTPPTTQELAERAGVSAASIFRYFDGLDELRGHTIVHFLGRYQGLFEVPPATGTLDERITSYVDSRLRLYETVAPVARMVRARMYDEPQLAEQLHRVRRQQAEQARAHFAVELDPLASAVCDDLVGLVVTTTAFEAWDQLTGDHGRTSRQVRRTWTAGLRTLLAHPPA